MDDRLVQKRLAAALKACTDGPWEHRFPWDDPDFARRFVRVTDENAQWWGPPEPDVTRLLDIWKQSHPDAAGDALPSVLDLACGAGRHAIALAWLGCDVIGVDVGGAAIDRALEKADKRGVRDIGFVEADIETYDPGRKFDLIQLLSSQCCNFPATELALLIRRYLEYLTDDGLLVLELTGPLPDPDVIYRKPGEHIALFSDQPYWEMQTATVDTSTRLMCDRYAVLTEVEDRVTVFTNWRLFYPGQWIAQMLPSSASLRLDRQLSRLDWCVISNTPEPRSEEVAR
ncbi:MAG: class I SAM-dependent methyltransferase [Chloroflexi bacterium]|nr:class I SAM-dependent methyltransferase [Chloroflexota bacterium]